MRKFFWVALCLCVLFISGCGGSLDPQDNDNTTQTISQDVAPSFNVSEILNGNWSVIDESIATEINYDGNTYIELIMASVSFAFTGTEIHGNNGTALVTSFQTWREILNKNSVRTYLGFYNLNIDNELMTLTNAGANKWRGEVQDTDRTIINLEILSPEIMRVTQEGISEIYDNRGMNYSFTFTMRKR